MSTFDEELQKATKEFYGATVRSNLMKITFGYDNIIVLPYKDGIKLLECLERAEQFCRDKTYEDVVIKPIKKNGITSCAMSFDEYSKYKIAMLLNINYKELDEKNE